jgi:hypothetical protein
MRKISLKTARAKGLKHYFTGNPCKRDHVCKRAVASRACVKCLAVNSAKWYVTGGKQTQRQWRTSPRGRASLNAFYKRWYATPAGKAYLKRNRTSPKARQAQLRANNSPLGHERQRRYRESPKGREAALRFSRSPKKIISDARHEAKRGSRLAYQRELRLRKYLDPDHPNFNPGRADWLAAKWTKAGNEIWTGKRRDER